MSKFYKAFAPVLTRINEVLIPIGLFFVAWPIIKLAFLAVFAFIALLVCSTYFDKWEDEFMSHPDANFPTGNEEIYVKPLETMPWHRY